MPWHRNFLTIFHVINLLKTLVTFWPRNVVKRRICLSVCRCPTVRPFVTLVSLDLDLECSRQTPNKEYHVDEEASRESRLNGSRYRNVLCTVPSSMSLSILQNDFRNPEFTGSPRTSALKTGTAPRLSVDNK